MATSQTLTNSIHMEGISLTASTAANTIYPVISATSSFDRRIYGLSLSSTSANTQTINVYLNNGTTNNKAVIVEAIKIAMLPPFIIDSEDTVISIVNIKVWRADKVWVYL